MGNNIETELKLQITDRKLWCDILEESLLVDMAVPGSSNEDTLEACYYDTPRHALKAARLAYRIRREGGRWVATVKGGGSSAGGLHTRQEYSVGVNDCAPSIQAFADTPMGDMIRDAVGEDKLTLLLITRFERKTLLVKMPDGSLIEAAADRGEIIAGSEREPIMELELELKSGNPASLLELGALLAERYPLLLEPRSKYYRGLILAGLEQEPNCRLTRNDPHNMTAAEDVVDLLNTKLCFLRRPDDKDILKRLHGSIQKLKNRMGSLRADMSDRFYQDIISGLSQFQREVSDCQGEELALVIGTGRYTALLLKIWAWVSKQE